MKKLIIYLAIIAVGGCASNPQVLIDPQSIKDGAKYEKDMAECKLMAESYDTSTATTGSGLIGAGAAIGTAVLVLATGGLFLLPVGVAAVGAGGAAVGGGISKNNEIKAREKIWAGCMNGRDYKAYTSN